MMPNGDMQNGSVIDLEDDRPIALRRKRRSSGGANIERDSQSKYGAMHNQPQGIVTPPSTPHRLKKRVRFSEPGPSSPTGLTPFFSRNSLSSPPLSKSRRHSTPSKSTSANRWNFSLDDSPIISGTWQFVPLRQRLDPRVKRRLRRRGLSEEVNIIELDAKEKKAQKSEIERLKEELRQKNQEIEHLKDEQGIASQIGVESGSPPTASLGANAKVKDLERQIAELRAELQMHETEAAGFEDPNWTMAAKDPFDEDTFMPSYDDDINAELVDIFHSTPGKGSFPSPPATMPNTPSKSLIEPNTIESIADAERIHLESQLESLQEELETLSKTLELTNTTHERLIAKLSPFMSEGPKAEDFDNLDAALDIVLTQLAISQASADDSTARFSALKTEMKRLFPASASTPSAPDAILQMLHNQFRAARLELEYLTPGENPEGFDNAKILDMLVARLKVLTKRVSQQDIDIDQYHEQERSLRQQLGSRVDAINSLQASLTHAKSSVATLESDLLERDESISKLTQALQGYRDEVACLETLVSRLEVEHAADVAILRDEIESVKKDGERKLLDSDLQRETLQAAAEGRETIMLELEQRLTTVLASCQTLRDEIAALQQEKTSVIATLKHSSSERERQHGEALALRDARVAELRVEIDRINRSLKEAHLSIVDLKREKRDLLAEATKEKIRAKVAVDDMRAQLHAFETGLGVSSRDTSIHGSNQNSTLKRASSSSSLKVFISRRRASSEPPEEVANLIGEENRLNTISSSDAMDGAQTAQEAVIKPGMFIDAALARKQGGRSKMRRRYDSGLVFLEEADELEALDDGTVE